MNPLNCFHIVPALSPQVNEVGEYALSLALHLRQLYGIHSRFIVCDPDWNGPSRVEGFGVRCLRLRNEAGIWSLLEAAKEDNAAVLLHYAAYDYDRMGMPLWLYWGVKSWFEDQTNGCNSAKKHFSTIFHDQLPLSAKPWEREFYLRKVQRAIVTGLHRRSKFSVTSTGRMKSLLEGIQSSKTLRLPTPSNAPIIRGYRSHTTNNAALAIAICGDQSYRCATIQAHANLLRTLDKKNLLGKATLAGRRMTDGGPDIDFLRKCVSRARIEVVDDLNPADLSEVLSRSNILLSDASGELAFKSNVVMSALAVSCPAVLRDGEDAESLNEGEHFIASDDSHSSVNRFEKISADGELNRIALAARLWYDRHADWKVVTKKYREAIWPGTPSPTACLAC
jgi:hypothetical protein